MGIFIYYFRIISNVRKSSEIKISIRLKIKIPNIYVWLVATNQNKKMDMIWDQKGKNRPVIKIISIPNKILRLAEIKEFRFLIKR